MLPLAGGLPIKSGDDVIGGIGVGGAPGGNLDEGCANAGIEKIKGAAVAATAPSGPGS